jgi:MerR family mercuric resistance operon transcriptional regulator
MSGLRAGDVAARAGVNRETLRYYERRKLIAEPVRSLGGHRLYPGETVTLLRVIKAAQRLGFTLDEVAELLAAGRHRHGAHGIATHAPAKLSEVEARIADLEVIRDRLRAVIDAGCDDPMVCAAADDCPLPFETLGASSRT